MKILLTGATGFIGGHLAQALVAERHCVGALVRDPARNGSLACDRKYLYDGSYGSVEQAVGDFSPDVAIHLATHYVASHEPADLDRLIDGNIRLGTILLEALAKSGCRSFINAGTRWQHKEDKAYGPVNLYAATKQAFQDILEYYSSAAALKAVTLELCDTFGPGDTRRKIVEILVSAAIRGEAIELTPGEQLVDVLYVDDAASAFLRALELVCAAPPGSNKTYSISSGETLRLRDIGGIIERRTGTADLFLWGKRPYRDREAMRPYRYFDALPGWAPAKSLEDWLAVYIAGRAGEGSRR
jgi:nucleoside-diphosphate-sugar epimerase